jgi:hypothetical protein
MGLNRCQIIEYRILTKVFTGNCYHLYTWTVQLITGVYLPFGYLFHIPVQCLQGPFVCFLGFIAEGGGVAD